MATFESLLGWTRLVPVIVLDDAARAPGLARALKDGGLPIAEVTFRSPGAEDVMTALARDPDLLVGAGTVRTRGQVDRAVDAGAQFVVSPGFSPAVVDRCREVGIPVLPGVSTATEIMAASDAGLRTVKFFPAEACGGLPTIKALAAAFPDLAFVPTGGITAELAADYLGFPAVVAVGGSWMVPPAMLAAGEFGRITELVASAVSLFPPRPPVADP